MALTPSGRISMGGDEPERSINVELGKNPTDLITLNDADARDLAGVPSGTISLSDFYGKSSGPDYLPCGWVPTSTADLVEVNIACGDGDMWETKYAYSVGISAICGVDPWSSSARMFDFTTFPPTPTTATKPPLTVSGFLSWKSVIINETESLVAICNQHYVEGAADIFRARYESGTITYTPITSLSSVKILYGLGRIDSDSDPIFMFVEDDFSDEDYLTINFNSFRFDENGAFFQGARVLNQDGKGYCGLAMSENKLEIFYFGGNIDPYTNYLTMQKIKIDEAMTTISLSAKASSPAEIDYSIIGIGAHIKQAGAVAFSYVTTATGINVVTFSDADTPVYLGNLNVYTNAESVVGVYVTDSPDCLLIITRTHTDSSPFQVTYIPFIVTLSGGVPVSITEHDGIAFPLPEMLFPYVPMYEWSDPIIQKLGSPHLSIGGYATAVAAGGEDLFSAMSIKLPS